MTSLDQIKYIVGIDFGTTTSAVSVAHVNDPLNIITVSTWDDYKRKSQKFCSSIAYPENEKDTPLCGLPREDLNCRGVYVDNICQYLVDIDVSNKKLGQLMDGLTIKKVITDYLKYFVELALKRLQVHEKLIHDMHFKEFVSEEFIDEDIKAAGIIEESEAEHRLLFSTRAVATAHCQLSLERNVTRIQNDQNYLVCDLDDVSIGIAKIQAASTESLSSVTAISDNLTLGSINLETKFEDYLMENMAKLNLNVSVIAQFVDAFSEQVQYAFYMDYPEEIAISQNDANGNIIEFTYEELNRIVFKEFIENITEYILNANKSHGYPEIFLSGQHTTDSHFMKELISKDEGLLGYNSLISLETISSGAVSSILSTCASQIPYFNCEQASTLDIFLQEPTMNVNENDAYDFIVGIDFGNSFSGCSYVQLRDKSRNPVTNETIKTIKGYWPTLLAYDENMKPKYWGEEARLQANRHENLHLLKDFQLFLCPDSFGDFYGEMNYLKDIMKKAGFADNETPKKGDKSEVFAVQAIADYLKLFKNHVVEYIVTKEMNENFNFWTRARLLKKYKIKYVITVPVMWNASARNTMVQAAIKATMIKKDEKNQPLIISKSEAAVLYYVKRFPGYFNSREGSIDDSTFILCDAGKETVGLVTFNLKVKGEKEPVIYQIGDGIGESCGSKCLDIRFKKYIRNFYKSCGVNLDQEDVPLDDVMRDFVRYHKPDFMPDLQGDSYFDINLPRKIADNKNHIMANGNTTLRIKNQDMKEKIFDPIVNRIFALIDDQRKQAEKGGRHITSILMVGGFSQSNYLQKRIKDHYNGMCKVNVPFKDVTAISQGAVCYGMNPRMISKRISEHSLGLEVQSSFSNRLMDSDKKKVKGPDGEENFKKSRLEYFVTRGQGLEGGKQSTYKKDVYVVYPNAAVIAIFSCDSEENANNGYLTKSHTKIVEANIVMPLMVGLDGKLIHFTVSLQIDHTGVNVIIECQDQLINAEVQKITRNQRSSLKIVPKCSLNKARSKHPLISYDLVQNGLSTV